MSTELSMALKGATWPSDLMSLFGARDRNKGPTVGSRDRFPLGLKARILGWVLPCTPVIRRPIGMQIGAAKVLFVVATLRWVFVLRAGFKLSLVLLLHRSRRVLRCSSPRVLLLIVGFHRIGLIGMPIPSLSPSACNRCSRRLRRFVLLGGESASMRSSFSVQSSMLLLLVRSPHSSSSIVLRVVFIGFVV